MHDWFDKTIQRSTWPPGALWMHGVTDDITWLIFTVLFLELVAQRTSIDPRHYIKSMKGLPLIYIWTSATDSSFQYLIFCLISALCVVTPWGQVNGGRLCEVPVTVLGEFNYLYPIFHFSFLYSAWPPYAPILICPSAIVHLSSGNMWGLCNKKTNLLSGIIMRKMDVVQLCSWNLTARILLMFFGLIVYCLQKSRFKESKKKAASMLGQRHLDDL